MLKAEQILALSLEELNALPTDTQIEYAYVLLARMELLLNRISDTRKKVCGND